MHRVRLHFTTNNEFGNRIAYGEDMELQLCEPLDSDLRRELESTAASLRGQTAYWESLIVFAEAELRWWRLPWWERLRTKRPVAYSRSMGKGLVPDGGF